VSRFVILLGGALALTPRLHKQVSGARAIAADSGMAHADALGLDVELWVGDFDSTSDELAARHAGIERQAHPCAKDATDGELAVAEALRRGAKEIVLVGAFGGQTDHLLGHAGMALRLALDGHRTFLTSGREATALARHVDDALVPLGFEREARGFSAHVTLGRVRTPRSNPQVAPVCVVLAVTSPSSSTNSTRGSSAIRKACCSDMRTENPFSARR